MNVLVRRSDNQQKLEVTCNGEHWVGLSGCTGNNRELGIGGWWSANTRCQAKWQMAQMSLIDLVIDHQWGSIFGNWCWFFCHKALCIVCHPWPLMGLYIWWVMSIFAIELFVLFTTPSSDQILVNIDGSFHTVKNLNFLTRNQIILDIRYLWVLLERIRNV